MHKDLFRQFPNRPYYGYVLPQFEFELRYYYNKSYFSNVCIQEMRDQVPQTLSLFLTLAPPKNLDQCYDAEASFKYFPDKKLSNRTYY